MSHITDRTLNWMYIGAGLLVLAMGAWIILDQLWRTR